MGSIIKVNEYKDFGNNAIMTSDGAGNVTVNADGLKNVPAFEAYLGATQAFVNNTATKVNFNTETFDTDGCYDNSTNYRFTPTEAGKYYVYSTIYMYQDSAATNTVSITYIYKNGSAVQSSRLYFPSNPAQGMHISVSGTYDMNGSTDYLEIYGQSTGDDGDFIVVTKNNLFGAYKLIGA